MSDVKNKLGNIDIDVLIYHLHDCIYNKCMSISQTDEYFRNNLHLTEYRVTPYQGTNVLIVSVTYTPVPDEELVHAEKMSEIELVESHNFVVDDLPQLLPSAAKAIRQACQGSGGGDGQKQTE